MKMIHDDLCDALCESHGYGIRGLRNKNYRTIATTNTLLETYNDIESMMARAYHRKTPAFKLSYDPADLKYLVEFSTESVDDLSVMMLPKPKHVMLNGDYTTIVWEDKTSTVLHLKDGETYDPEKVILYGILKKMFNNKNADMNKYLKEFFDHTISHNK